MFGGLLIGVCELDELVLLPRLRHERDADRQSMHVTHWNCDARCAGNCGHAVSRAGEVIGVDWIREPCR